MGDARMIKNVVDITEIDYSDYGILFNMTGEGVSTANTNCSEGDGWRDVDTAVPLLDTVGRLGYTYSTAQPFVAREMERHSHTREAQIPIDQPICLCMARASAAPPKAEDVIAVRIRPGYVFVLYRDVWHSASHGVYKDGYYHWMAQVYEGEPTVWSEIAGGPIDVRDTIGYV